MDKTIKIITTNYEKQELWQEREATAEEVGCMHLIKPYPEVERQTMKGFGGAFTEAAGYCYEKLSAEAKKEFIKAYFSPEGLRYNVGRTHINSCDFALENYAAVEDEADTEFKTFDLSRANRYVLPLILDAQKEARDGIPFLVSPWSPPAFMKTNGEMNNGGKLKEEYYGAWAAYIAKYIQELQNAGLDIRYMTVQNEPDAVQTWDSCIYTAKEEVTFAKDYLANALKEAGLDHIGIMVWDHNKEVVYERAGEILDTEGASECISGIAVHWYMGDHFEGLRMVKEKYPDKDIFFTEGCVEYSRFGDFNEVKKAEMYAHDMLGNFKNGVGAFYDWNLLLDAKGGPNHVGNFCDAPIMSNETGESFEKRLSYYYIGHFSRYIKNGAKAIALTSYNELLEAVAFTNPDGERVIVILNRQDQEMPAAIGENGCGCNVMVPGHSIMTICY